jgi:flagellar basal-body rod modification protein FlgD
MQTNIVSPFNPTASGEKTTSPTQPEAQGLGEDAFMKLLLAQLQNQDPLKPMEDKEFIAQLAQFNSLNQLTQLNKTLGEFITMQSLSQGSALIGKMVTGVSSQGQTVSGLVSGLRMVAGKTMLDLNGQPGSLDLENVKSVQEVERKQDDGGQDQASTDSSSGE